MSAYIASGRLVSPFEFVKADVDKLAGRLKKRIGMNAEQKSFLALAADAIDNILQVRSHNRDHGDGTITFVEPKRILLCGPGGAGKTELVAQIPSPALLP